MGEDFDLPHGPHGGSSSTGLRRGEALDTTGFGEGLATGSLGEDCADLLSMQSKHPGGMLLYFLNKIGLC